MLQKMSHRTTCQIIEKKKKTLTVTVSGPQIMLQYNITDQQSCTYYRSDEHISEMYKKICPKYLDLKTITISSIHTCGKPGLF